MFWIDVGLHPEKEYSSWDYLATLAGGYFSGYLGGRLGVSFTDASLKSLVGCFTLIALVGLAYFGYIIKILGEYIMETNDNMEADIFGWLLSTLGDAFMALKSDYYL